MGVLLFIRSGAALFVGAMLGLATPIWAQDLDFTVAANNAATSPLQTALSSEKTPLTLQASALNASWRRFKPSKSLGADFQVRPADSEDATNYENYSYVTRGETLKVGDETFLLAYRTPYFIYQELDASMPVSPAERESIDLMRSVPPEANIATPDRYVRLLSVQTLNLCLLNVRTIGDLGDIRAFDAATDTIEIVLLAERTQLRGEAVNEQVVRDLRQIGQALVASAEDYDQEMPPMLSAQSMAEIKLAQNVEFTDDRFREFRKAQQVLLKEVESAEIFAHPITREIYRPNVNLSRRPFYLLTPRNQVVTFYEASPAPNGTRAVLYFDGHVKRERETDWPAIRAASDAIAPPFKPTKRAATVTLTSDAAMAYQIAQWKKNPQHTQTLYLSKSTNRVYYRDDETHQAIFIDSPAKGIALSVVQAAPFRDYKGYNGQKSGRVLTDDFKVN